MFTLKIILKNVQKLNVSHHYVQNVFQSGAGQEAMLLASKVSLDLHYRHNVNYLVNDKSLSENSNVCTGNSPPFSHVLFNYVCEKSDLFSKQEHSRERSTRSDEFSIEDAKDASVSYKKNYGKPLIHDCVSLTSVILPVLSVKLQLRAYSVSMQMLLVQGKK